MKHGVILTAAPNWQWVLDEVPPHIDTIKVVSAWGLPWNNELRRAVFDRFSTVILRTRAGDASHLDGSYFMPEAYHVTDEVRPWYAAWNRKSRFIVQIGNEPLLQPIQNEIVAWQYAYHLGQAQLRTKNEFPSVELMSFAHMLNHWVLLNGRNDGQRRWTEICRDVLASYDLLAINAYTPDQIQLGLALYQGVGLNKPVWLSEFNLNERLEEGERGRRFLSVLSPLRGRIEGVTAYHLVHEPDDHPIHSNPNYTIRRKTLDAWRREEYNTMTQSNTLSPSISWVGMTRPHFWEGRGQPVRCIVVHSTAGRFPGDYNWLRNGGHPTDKNSAVSVHFYISKQGVISQMVKEGDRAWHAGVSAWQIDGIRREGLNHWSIGIELENANNGVDPYPKAQFDACIALVKYLASKYSVPRSQVVTHYQISPGRKTDPRGFPWDRFLDEVFDNPWTAWGTEIPLSEAQRGWLIPQTWLKHRNKLGAAVSNEQYLTSSTSAQVFERGLIVFNSTTKSCTVVEF